MSHRVICQVVDTLAPGSAVSNCVMWAHTMLQEHGYDARVHARIAQPGVERPKALGWARWHSALFLYHFSVGSPMTQWVQRRARRGDVVLWYHNLTPPHYFHATDPFLAGRLVEGHDELRRLVAVCRGAIADSEFNAQELRALGYQHVRVVPPLFLDDRYRIPPAPQVLRQGGEHGGNWLFVGRLVPNKRQDEIIAAFHAFKRLVPQAQLFLVGTEGTSLTYRRWLDNLVAYLGLAGHVHLVGHVSQAELNAYYRIADCFVSMSEHEGFGVPLVESVYFDVPVIAYAAAAVPETLGHAGVLMRERDPYLVAEIAYLLYSDPGFREAILARQRQRLADFSLEATRAKLLEAVSWFGQLG